MLHFEKSSDFVLSTNIKNIVIEWFLHIAQPNPQFCAVPKVYHCVTKDSLLKVCSTICWAPALPPAKHIQTIMLPSPCLTGGLTSQSHLFCALKMFFCLIRRPLIVTHLSTKHFSCLKCSVLLLFWGFSLIVQSAVRFFSWQFFYVEPFLS